MAPIQRSLLVLALLGAVGCAGFQVQQDYDPDTDFSGYKTWYWLPPSPSGDPRVDNDLSNARVQQAVESSLAARGFRRTSTGEGDFGVGYHVLIEGKTSVRVVDDYYGYGPGWGRYGGVAGGVSSQTYVDQYEQGTLILDVVDTRSMGLVWRGSTSARVQEDLEPQERKERIQKAVDAILAEFPPS